MGQPTDLQSVLAELTPLLTKLAERLCSSPSEAADLVQDTAERAMRLGLPAELRSARAWLTTMMHNLFIDRCRAAARIPPHEPLEDVHDNITPLEVASAEPAWSCATLDDVRTALDHINGTYREVYILHTFERRSYEDIAAQLRINRITVGTRLTRARQELRKVLVARLGVERKS